MLGMVNAATSAIHADDVHQEDDHKKRQADVENEDSPRWEKRFFCDVLLNRTLEAF